MPDQPAPKKKSVFEQLIDMVTLREVEKQRKSILDPASVVREQEVAIPPTARSAFPGPPPETGPPGANFRRDVNLPLDAAGKRRRAVELLTRSGQPISPESIEQMIRQMR